MEMGVDRHDTVERIGEEPTNDFLADRFAGMKSRILAHIAHIGRNQDQPLRSVAPQGLCGEQDGEELVVRLVERRINDRDRRSRSYADPQFAVGKPVNPDLMCRKPKLRSQSRRVRRPGPQTLDDDPGHGVFSLPLARCPSMT